MQGRSRTESPSDRTSVPVSAERLWRDVLGEQLRATRTDRKETLEAIARRANVSVQYLSEIERGRKEASSEVTAAVAAALELTLLDLTMGAVGRLHAEPASRRGQVALAA